MVTLQLPLKVNSHSSDYKAPRGSLADHRQVFDDTGRPHTLEQYVICPNIIRPLINSISALCSLVPNNTLTKASLTNLPIAQEAMGLMLGLLTTILHTPFPQLAAKVSSRCSLFTLIISFTPR